MSKGRSVVLLVVLTALVACTIYPDDESSVGISSEAIEEGVRLQMLHAVGQDDVLAFQVIIKHDGVFVVSDCIELEDETLPSSFLPDGSGEEHRFADQFMVLAASEIPYTVTVTPVQSCDPLEISEYCAVATGEAVVEENQTTELVLVSQCDMPDSGALDTVIALNHDPVILDLDYDDSKFIQTCEPLTITVTAEDQDGDDLEYEWTITPPDGDVSYESEAYGNSIEFMSSTAGTYYGTIAVCDNSEQCAYLDFPIYVTMSNDENENGVGDECEEESNPDPPVTTPEFVLTWGSYGSGPGEFNRPFGIALLDNDDVFVTDRDNHRIQKFDSMGNYLTSWGSYGSGDNQFISADNVTVDNYNFVYVSDWDSHQIQKTDSSGSFIRRWGSYGSGPGEFNRPYGMAVDSANRIYVADRRNNRIQKFTNGGVYMLEFGGLGSGDGQLNSPVGVAVDQTTDTVYVVESEEGNNRVQMFTSEGVYLGQWGSYGTGPGEFIDPYGITVDSAGYVYVTDRNNHRIQKFSSDGTFILEINNGNGSGDGQFAYPAGIASGSDDSLYIVDVNNSRVQKFSN